MNRDVTMTPPEALLTQGLELYHAGAMAEAEAVFRALLDAAPNHADALHLLAVVVQLDGRVMESADLAARAVALSPDMAVAHNTLGNAWWRMRRIKDARASFQAALGLQPDYGDALINLGLLVKETGAAAEAEALLLRAERLMPGQASILFHLGILLRERRELGASEIYFRAASLLRPAHEATLDGLGMTLWEQGAAAEAERCWRRVLRLDPGNPSALINLANIPIFQGRLSEAEAQYRDLLAANPANAVAHNNLCCILSRLGDSRGAVEHAGMAIALMPGYPDAYVSRGNALFDLGRLDEAAANLRQALVFVPERGEPHLNLGLILLLQGNLPEGFREYFWRFRPGLQQTIRPVPPGEFWDGAPPCGKRILVHAEQGYGDAVQFARYLPIMERLGHDVVFCCERQLIPLLKPLCGAIPMVPNDEPLPPYDCHAALLDLPMRLGTTVADIPADIPYLFPDAGRMARWRRKLGTAPGVKVGLCWQGNPNHFRDWNRSIPLAHLLPLLRVPGTRVFSLQIGPARARIAELPDGVTVEDWGGEFDNEEGAFIDALAAMACLDLVISVDTAIAHVAGAAGLNLWVPLAAMPDWRWLLGRNDSPWYPSLRLFRQSDNGDWSVPIAEMTACLTDLAARS